MSSHISSILNISVDMTVKHLEYLLDIYSEQFDAHVHTGRYATDGELYAITVQELIRLGLVRYEGHHFTTHLGTEYVLWMLSQKPQNPVI
jgi:hypothetical protein